MSRTQPTNMARDFSDDPVRSLKRLAALERTELLDSLPEANFDRITQLAARLLRSKVSLLSLVDVDRQYFKSATGLGEPYASTRETALTHSFCKHVVASGEPLVVRDARDEPTLAVNGAVADLGVIAYLGVPVKSPDDQILGSLCAIHTEPRDWSNEDVELLKELAHIVEDEIALRIQAETATVLAIENSVLAREYHHRVKNALAVSAALVKLSRRDASSVDDLVDKAGGRLAALATAHDSLLATGNDVDLKGLAARLLLPYASSGSTADVDGPSVMLRQQQVTPICLILHELATNSAKYGALRDDGNVSVRWEYANAHDVSLYWQEQLAIPVQDAPSGFGTKLLDMAAHQLGGQCAIAWTSDGLSVTIGFPLIRG